MPATSSAQLVGLQSTFCTLAANHFIECAEVRVDPAVDRAIQRLATRREGRLTTAELRRAGLSPAAIKARVDRGTFTRLRRGLYAVGDPALHRFGPEAAALAAAGKRAVLSHRSAAFVSGMRARRPKLVEVTVVGRRLRSWPGVLVHYVATLSGADVRTVHGLLITAPARTVLDLASRGDRDEIESAIDEARVRELLTPQDLQDVANRYPRRRGARLFNAVLEDETSGGTRSRAERLLRKLIEDAGLPQPETNAKVHGHRVDKLWRDHKLVVEFDGFNIHQTREAFENDRRRDRELAAKGYVVLRVTWRHLTKTPTRLIAEVAAALAIRQQASAA
jgi:very-short-patch-repair endonuclease